MIRHGDCLEILPTLPAESIDAIVTDPPYGLSFMGQNWDHGIPGVAFWSEALRVAKPGTHLLAFGGTRTFHRLTCAIEDAGWEIRDCIMWVYGSGFPKSHDVSKAIDREAGAERTKLGINPNSRGDNRDSGGWKRPWQADPEAAAKMITAPATPAAQQWQGWGTALKPAWEPIIVSRKPLAGTVAQNVQQYGMGAVNVDGCRVKFVDESDKAAAASQRACQDQNKNRTAYGKFDNGPGTILPYIDGLDRGRWPANLIHDGSDEVTGLFPVTTSGGGNKSGQKNSANCYGKYGPPEKDVRDIDTGSSARFFYCAKASKADRDEGNRHPTVKPTSLMRYLCRLVTPPGGTVLDPFCGSGSTGKAATLEGFNFIGIEREAEYVEIARARIAAAKPDMPLLVNA